VPWRFKVRVRQARDADRDVDAFADDVHDAVGQVQVHAHFAMLGQEGGDERRDVLAPEPRRCGHDEVTGGARAALGHGRFRFFQFCKDPLAILKEHGAFVRQRQLARGTL
jgi:hypothetical protein